jgi:hypothetical protein
MFKVALGSAKRHEIAIRQIRAFLRKAESSFFAGEFYDKDKRAKLNASMNLQLTEPAVVHINKA